MRFEPWLLELVFLVYGLSFVVIGVAILSQPLRQSRFEIAPILWLFALYSLLHAPADFIDLLAVRNDLADGWLRLGTLLTYASYAFLFEFGRRLWGLTLRRPPWWTLPCLAAAVLTGSALTREPWASGHAFVGYLIRTPAGIMAGIGFLSYFGARRSALAPLGVRRHFLVAAATLLAWAFFCGVVRAKAPFFPASALNLGSFAATVGMPVHVFRAACALAAAWAISGMLKITFRETARTVENALLLQEKITSGTTDEVVLLDADRNVVWANRAAREAHGEPASRKCHEFLHGKDEPCAARFGSCPVEASQRGDRTCKTLHRVQDGQLVSPSYVEVEISPVLDRAGGIVEYVHVSRDVTDRLVLQEAIKKLSDPLLVVGLEGILTTVNDSAAELSGRAEADLVGRRLDEFLDGGPLSDARDLRATWSAGSGERVPVGVSASAMRDHSGRLLGHVVLLRDLREKERVEAELRQSQKLEAIGLLAGGVAHDFNNLLQVIQENVESIAGDVPAARTRDVEEVRAACERGASLTRQLLVFSRKAPPNPLVFDLNDAVWNILRLLGRIIGESIALESDIDPSPCPIRADRNHIEQVMMNLAVNARDAMPGGGKLAIGTRTEAGRALLTVRDTGIGMDEKVRSHLFEPFFTTKEPGKGTGLGLATVHGIVSQSGGSISVATKPGGGTTFTLSFPRVEDVAAVKPEGAAPRPKSGNGECVLVVEDSPEVRRGIRRSLESDRYRVIEAPGGAEALALWSSHEPRPDLVITDVSMPGMTGTDLARKLRDLDPACPVLFTSGHPDVQEMPRCDVLLKPFTREALLTRVGEALGGIHTKS